MALQSIIPYDPKFDALNLFKSFFEEVLLLSNPPMHLQVPTIDIKKRGGSTQAATPPAVWFKKGAENYVGLANPVCGKHEAELSGSYLPAPYSPCILQSEADIVRSATLWLLHPVIIALQKEAGSWGTECYAEVTIDDCRCDALIKIGGQPVVVLEYKNRGHINRGEFEAGRIRDPTYANRAVIQDRIQTALRNPKKSNMGHNAVCITKQAAAYATKWKTRFVALFDWDNLFLWNFAGCDFRSGAGTVSPGLGPDGHAMWAWGTLVESRKDYRKALLGFVLEAWADKKRGGFRIPRPAPFEPTRAEKERKRAQSNANMLAKMTPQEQANQQIYGRRP